MSFMWFNVVCITSSGATIGIITNGIIMAVFCTFPQFRRRPGIYFIALHAACELISSITMVIHSVYKLAVVVSNFLTIFTTLSMYFQILGNVFLDIKQHNTFINIAMSSDTDIEYVKFTS